MENIELELNDELIEAMIYELREKKVMLDFELAKIYGYETKRFNEQVQRNINKFAMNSLFQLTKNELDTILMSQNVTSSSTWGGTRKLPYAFSEDAIELLSTILKPKNDISTKNVILLNNYFRNKYTIKQPNKAINYEIVKFESDDILLDVRVSPTEDTIWLTQQDIAILFDTTIQNISMHISNIYDENELEIGATIKDSLTVQIEGDRKVSRTIRYYNLDMVLSIGYRVNTKRGIEFRKWANKVLRQYLIKGYAINEKRCLEHSDILLKLTNEINALKLKSIEYETKIEAVNIKIDKVIKTMEKLEINKHFLILDGKRIEADLAYQSIFELAKSSVYVIDDYIDIKTLQLLKCLKANINVVIISDNKTKNNLNLSFIKDFIKDTNINISFKKNHKKFHDRYIVIDYNAKEEKLYHCGGSFKDGGNSISTIDKIEEIELYKPSIDIVLNNDELIFQ